MVNGKWLMQDKILTTVDENKIAHDAAEYARNIDIFLQEREQSVLSKLVAIGGMERQESFEIQAKARINNMDDIITVLNKELRLLSVHLRIY